MLLFRAIAPSGKRPAWKLAFANRFFTKKKIMPDKPTITYDDFAKLDLRIATVLAAREHPNADKLLLLQIKVGEVEKQIVAGIRAFYKPEDLVGRQVVVVNNLAEAMLRGEESHGMLLAASDAGGVVLLKPEREMESGSGVK